MKFFRDPVVRRFLSGTAFAGLFIWVAIRYFKVDLEVVIVFFVFSVVLVVGMVVMGVAGGALLAMLRRRDDPGMLSGLPDAPDQPGYSEVTEDVDASGQSEPATRSE